MYNANWFIWSVIVNYINRYDVGMSMIRKKAEKKETTTIVLEISVYTQLKDMKIIPEEPFSAAIQRIITENRQFKKITPSLQTKEKMEKEMREYVMNPKVPDDINHRKIWQNAHPNEPLTSEDIIHHINGNHDDNRIENLQKTNTKEHASLHNLKDQQLKTE